jgi:hypothetical protein
MKIYLIITIILLIKILIVCWLWKWIAAFMLLIKEIYE